MMNPFISWILFLGLSGTFYIALKGVPCLKFFTEDKIRSNKIEEGLLGQKVRKKRRLGLDKVLSNESMPKYRDVCVQEVIKSRVLNEATNTTQNVISVQEPSHSTIKCPLYASKSSCVPVNPVLCSRQTLDFSIPKKPSESVAIKSVLAEQEGVKTKKQRQNAVKREKQKLLKARIEEERLKNLRNHQKMLEEERVRALTHQTSHSAWRPRSDSGEWTVVGAKGNRHVMPVFATTAG